MGKKLGDLEQVNIALRFPPFQGIRRYSGRRCFYNHWILVFFHQFLSTFY